MSKREAASLAASDSGALRIYRMARKGHLLFACRKCQKKLKSSEEPAKLKKALKRRGKQDPAGLRLRVLQVPCLKVCPKGGVAVASQHQLARGECSIVRTPEDVDALYAQCREEAGRIA